MAKDLIPLIMDADTDPWERQSKESVLRFNQFCGYRGLGRTRTLRKVTETLALNDRYVRSVAAAYRWVERAEAWDLHRDELDQQAWLVRRRAAADNDAKLLDAALAKIAQRLKTLTLEELSPTDLIRLFDVSLKHRRTLFGDPVTTVALTGPRGDPLTVQLAEFAHLSIDQRRQAILDLTDAVRRRADAAAGVDDDADG